MTVYRIVDKKGENMLRKSQTGRSMVEILGVMVLIGVLSVGTVYGIRYLLDKNMANRIISDAQTAYLLSDKNACMMNFVPVEFSSESKKPIDAYCDGQNKKYIRISDISDEVCHLVLDFEQSGRLDFYSYDDYGEPTCDKGENALIFAFNGVGFPALPCHDFSDCPDSLYGICHQTQKLCMQCGPVQMPNADKDLCVEVNCQPDTETMCDMDGFKWCCPNIQLCGSEQGECVDSDGMCLYVFAEPVVTKTADCAYTFNEPVVTKAADCAYTFNEPILTKTADCAYMLISETRSDGTQTIGLKEEKPCADNLYCNLRYADDSCGTQAPANTPVGTIMYGSCSPMNTSYAGCNVTIDSSNVLVAEKTCADNLYCNLRYADDSCGTQADASINNKTLYGSCSPMNTSYAGCNVTIDSSNVLEAEKTCVVNLYCNLRYADEWCETSADASINNKTLYGSCSPMNTSYAGCTASIDMSDVLTVKTACPATQYCHLKYKDADCTPAPADIFGNIYGVCLDPSSSQTICPVPKE